MGDMMNPNGAGHELVPADHQFVQPNDHFGQPAYHVGHVGQVANHNLVQAANHNLVQAANHNLVQADHALQQQVQHKEQFRNDNEQLLLPFPAVVEEENYDEVAGGNANPQVDVNDNIHYSLDQVPDKDIYYKLIEMFPYTDFNDIRKLLIHPPFNVAMFDKNSLITEFTVHCLNLRTNPDQNVAQAQDNNFNNRNCTAMLEDIFPDADPMYLAEFVSVNGDDLVALNNFIEQNVANPIYPTKEQYLARERRAQLENQFINDFNVENFLRLYEDPFAYFGNPDRKCQYNESAFNFLKHQHNTIKVSDIKGIYFDMDFHLTRTDERLSQMKRNMKTKRYLLNCLFDEDILHEVAFIKNKNQIRHYLTKKAEEEAQEYNECKEKNLLVGCECCYESITPSKVATCSKAHIFCKSCMMESIKVKMTDGVYSLQCFADCDGQFNLEDIKKVFSDSLFEIFFKKFQAEEVARALQEELGSCPFCGSLGPVAEDDKIFKCPDPKCSKESCRNCKAVNHLPMKCKNILETEKARLLIEEKMTLALIRKCSNCHRSLCKDDGCNKIKCPNCHTVMCYLCNTVIENNYKHFRGQGSDRFDLCPLWSDDQQFDTEYVKKVGLEAKQQVESQNPDIKIDIDVLLPSTSTAQTQSQIYAKSILSQGDKFAEFARIRDGAAKKAE